ncbi:hypothetical protein H072_7313 [Dactylellina haptotyla CBS 200.50]|uniref:Extracellular membrane protein CFEM domain-containing protein n=1 Tax=Dactylellina haptotyla (strain CBS 200.50) TaxID=1284197 RepID=S8A7E4_DACHA|nr:hypothetical protein H072_7313 [Dactylellina haptotyla CBS 200.50]
MQLKHIIIAFASVALVSAVAIPEPQITASPTFKCGCTNACIIACAGKSDCFCPQYCDPAYECPVASTTLTPIKPTATCGCLNDCIVGCPDLRLCKCADYCDPKYACPTTTPSKTTTSVKPTFTCGCTNDCFVNCPPGESCICPLYCDLKYACPTLTTSKKVTATIVPYSLTPISTTTPCGCYNDCTLSCGKKAGCVCPQYCDPKYACVA